VILYGLYRRPIFLASKLDECQCGVMGPHWLVRKTYWIHIFFVPVILVWVSHGMICGNCGTWTKLSYLQVRRAMKSGQLPMERARPKFEEQRPQWADAWGRLPTAGATFDKLAVNPKPGLWNTYIKVWVAAVPTLVVLLIVSRFIP